MSRITPARFAAVLQELIDENPLAVRATLRILPAQFTGAVPTLAVSCEERPRLLVNPAFIAAHCHTDVHLKAVLCHEFLHVLLRHTEQRRPLTAARHLATDAVINAIIHRSLVAAYSDMMAGYYAQAQGCMQLLRPPTPRDIAALSQPARRGGSAATIRLAGIWQGLYAGRLVADDIEAVARDLLPAGAHADLARLAGGAGPALLGGHAPAGQAGAEPELPQVLRAALDQSLREMNGSGVWRSPRSRGVGASAYEMLVRAAHDPLARWRRATLQVLRRHVMPDRRAPHTQTEDAAYRLPVLSSGDRRALLQSLWLPCLPQARWSAERPARCGSTQVYLDVSGSMEAEMAHLVALLGSLGAYIRKPLWAFSDEVAPALIRGGRLVAQTSGGTSLSCVLRHVAATRPAAAVIVTDGFIEQVPPKLLRQAAGTRLHVLLSREGSALMLERAGMAYTQLERMKP